MLHALLTSGSLALPKECKVGAVVRNEEDGRLWRILAIPHRSLVYAEAVEEVRSAPDETDASSPPPSSGAG